MVNLFLAGDPGWLGDFLVLCLVVVVMSSAYRKLRAIEDQVAEDQVAEDDRDA